MLRIFRRPRVEPARFDQGDIAAVAAWIASRYPDTNNPGCAAVGLLAGLAADRNRRRGL